MTDDWAEKIVNKYYEGDVEAFKADLISKPYIEIVKPVEIVKPDDKIAKLFDGYNEKNTVLLDSSLPDNLAIEGAIRELNKNYNNIEYIAFNLGESDETNNAKRAKEVIPYEKLSNLKEVIGWNIAYEFERQEATEILQSKLLPSA